MIIVSGATGFLGAHVVCLLLQKGMEVKAMRRSSSPMDEFNYIFSVHFENFPDAEKQHFLSKLSWTEADILDIPSLEEALEGAHEVYHCAATVSFEQKHAPHMMQVNVTGTANMVNIALGKGVKKFCHVSSIAALGRERSGAHISEESKWSNSKLNSNYAVSKYKAEMEVWRGIEEGLNAVIVNPGVIIGVGNWNKGSCKLFELPAKGFPFYTTGVNGYVDVRDVARAMYDLMQLPSAFRRRYVLVGENLNMQHFMNTCADLFGTKRPKIEVKKLLAEISWRLFAIRGFFTGKASSITKETARASLNTYFYSSSRIEKEAGFRFTPMQETLRYICQHFKQQHT